MFALEVFAKWLLKLSSLSGARAGEAAAWQAGLLGVAMDKLSH